LTPVFGKPRSVSVPVTGGGYFSYAFRPSVNTVVQAYLVATDSVSAAQATTVAVVVPVPRCHLAATISRNVLTPLTCTLALLPKGTKVTLQFSAHKRWYTAVSGRATAGKATVRLHWSHAQLLWLRVVVSGSKVYGQSVGKPFSIRVT
jgi:hypothetical protein